MRRSIFFSFHGVSLRVPLTIRIAADWQPRRSPPAACAPSSAASMRSARSPFAASYAAAIAGTTSLVRHDVRLHRVVVADMVSRERDALRARVRRGVTLRVDEAELAHIARLVRGDELRHRIGRGHSVPHQREALRSIGRLDIGLRRDRTDAGLGPRHRAADRELVRLHRDADVAGHRIARDDRERVRRLDGGSGPRAELALHRTERVVPSAVVAGLGSRRETCQR